jgi:serine/threonine-protein kinase RsbW
MPQSLPGPHLSGPSILQDAIFVLRIAFDLPQSLRYIMHLRRNVRSLVEELGVPQKDADDVELLLGELATNAVRHGHSEAGRYYAVIDIYEDRVIVTVADTGIGFSPQSVLPPGTSRRNDSRENEIKKSSEGEDARDGRIGGFGLPLVYSVADRVDIRTNRPQGAIVCAEKRLHAEDSETMRLASIL